MGKKAPVKGSKKTNNNYKEFRGKMYKPVMYVSTKSKTMAAMDVETNEILFVNDRPVSFKSL